MDEVRSFLVGIITSPTPNRFIVPSGKQNDLPFYQPSNVGPTAGGTHLSSFVRGAVNVGNLVVNIGGNTSTTGTKRIVSNNRSRKKSETKRQKQCKLDIIPGRHSNKNKKSRSYFSGSIIQYSGYPDHLMRYFSSH